MESFIIILFGNFSVTSVPVNSMWFEVSENSSIIVFFRKNRKQII